MKDLLSIGEAAKRLGLSVDTVRELESSGALKATRTPGGHRRFKPAVLDAYLNRTEEPRRNRRPAVELQEPEWVDTETNWEPPRSVTPVAPPLVPKPSPYEGVLKELRETAGERAELNRLNGLRAYGQSLIPWSVSAGARSAVLETVATYVTASRFPASLSSWEAHDAIKAKVEAILEPYKAAEAREAARKAEKERKEQRVRTLIEHGKSRARTKTFGWGYSATTEACAEVHEELESEVESDWSEREVDEMVDDILDEWEEETDD